MIYSVLEQHTDGVWWYHGHRFSHDTREAADEQAATYFDWQPRPMRVTEHNNPLPNDIICTRNGVDFFPVAAEGCAELYIKIK